MGQPIFAIKKSKVKEIIHNHHNYKPIPCDYEWGEARSLEHVLNKIDCIQCIGDYIKMHDLHSCFQTIETHKIPAYANRMLKRILTMCKSYREDLNKISVEQH